MADKPMRATDRRRGGTGDRSAYTVHVTHSGAGKSLFKDRRKKSKGKMIMKRKAA